MHPKWPWIYPASRGRRKISQCPQGSPTGSRLEQKLGIPQKGMQCACVNTERAQCGVRRYRTRGAPTDASQSYLHAWPDCGPEPSDDQKGGREYTSRPIRECACLYLRPVLPDLGIAHSDHRPGIVRVVVIDGQR